MADFAVSSPVVWLVEEDKALVDALYRRMTRVDLSNCRALNNQLRSISEDISADSGVHAHKTGIEILERILKLLARVRLFEAFIPILGIKIDVLDPQVITVSREYYLSFPLIEEPPIFRCFRKEGLPNGNCLRDIFNHGGIGDVDFDWIYGAQLAWDRGIILNV